MVGIIQEQHPDRARLFMQWKQMDWPILVDSLDLLQVQVVPLTLAIDEYGIIRQIQPRRDRLAQFRKTFVEVEFAEPPGVEASASPQPATGSPLVESTSDGPAALRSRAHERYLWGDETDIDELLAAFESAVAADPGHGYELFRTGVAYRRRYDSSRARRGDFQRAVRYWERALEVDPNNYIWRRRIQQYGPRLDKPYPFYDWVPVARREIAARGEVPSPLVVEPGGAEFAGPAQRFAIDQQPSSPPELNDRILRDQGEFVLAESTMVPSTVAPGASTRAHVTFVPNDAIKAHWNNEVDGLVFWVDVPEGWQVDHRVLTVPNPPAAVSRELRKVELEIQVPDGAAAGPVLLQGYALYYVCEDVNGVCLYRRQDVPLQLRVARQPQ